MPSNVKEPSSATVSSAAAEAEDFYEQHQESKLMDSSRRVSEKETSTEEEKQSSSFSSFNINGRDESGVVGMEKERVDVKNSLRGSTSQKTFSAGYTQSLTDVDEKVQKISSPRQKSYREDRLEKQGLGIRRDFDNLDIMSPTSYKQQNTNTSNANNPFAKPEPEQPRDESINEILEVGSKVSLDT